MRNSERVWQRVDAETPVEFVKQVLVVQGPAPLSLVRKRLPPEQLQGKTTHAALVLTHGFGQNRYAWHLSSRSLANHFARSGFDVFNLDLRGHGQLSSARGSNDHFCRRVHPRRFSCSARGRSKTHRQRSRFCPRSNT